MQGTGKLTWVGGSLGAVGLLFVACAGGDTPPRPDGFSDELRAAYANEAGAAGSTGSSSAGAGGSSSSGAGGTASAPVGTAGAGGTAPVGAAGTTTGSAGTGTGAAGTGSAGTGSASNVCDAPTKVFTPSCGASGCHDAASTLGNFGGGDAAARALVDKPGLEGLSCGKFIDSANPQASLIYTMTLDMTPKGCFPSPMPFGQPALSDADTACITSWLSQF